MVGNPNFHCKNAVDELQKIRSIYNDIYGDDSEKRRDKSIGVILNLLNWLDCEGVTEEFEKNYQWLKD